MAGEKGNFFVEDAGGRPATAVSYDTPRPMTAGSAVLDFKKKKMSPIRAPHAWQKAAWDFTDQIGELKYAFGLIAQLVSRAAVYAAVNFDDKEVPVPGAQYLAKFDDVGSYPSGTSEAVKIANEVMDELGNKSEILRLLTLNYAIAGECYLHNIGDWSIASVSEFTPGTPPKFNRHKDINRSIRAPSGSYVARLWRAHPRWSGEADSTMLGVLDLCDKMILFDQAVRSVTRSRLGAGIVFVPAGLTPASGEPIEEAIAKITVNPVEDETAIGTVAPLIMTGPIDLADKIKRIDLARGIDPEMTRNAEITMNRILDGIDIPKNVVTGFEGSRYAVAVVVDDSLYKAHIEPMIMLICDSLTSAYLWPMLRRRGISESVLKKFVVWYNPSKIVTRPDKSQSANEGYDRFLLSGDAWRSARGYGSEDAPKDEELLRRMALEKTPVPPDLASTIVEQIYPEFFKRQHAAGAEQAGIPSDIQSLLNGNGNGAAPTAAPPAPAPDTTAPAPTDAGVSETQTRTNEASGGDLNNNSSQPPSPLKR